MSKIRYTDLAQSLPSSVPFVAPEMMERAKGEKFAARLGANENNFGPSPKVQDAILKAGLETWKYPDPTNLELRTALSEKIGVGIDHLIVGSGIDGLLGNLCRLLIEQGDMVVTSAGAYPTFNYHVSGFGGALDFVPYRDDHEDLEALSKRVHAVGAKLVYLANPDNPMGTIHGPEKIAEFIQSLPTTTLLILDEAYIEFADPDMVLDMASYPNVIRFRTFSKAYGLAGARVGYGIADPELIASFDKIRNHFGVSKVSQVAALAALQDQDYLSETLDRVQMGRAEIAKVAHENGLAPLASATNFVTIDCGSDGVFAKRVLDELLALGIFVRMPFSAPENRCIRVSVGLPEEIDAFAGALPVALDKARMKD